MQALGKAAGSTVRSYASVPMLRFAYRVCPQPAPWISVDPELKGECTSLIRSIRLVLFALFALLAGPLKSRSAMAENVPESASIQLNTAASHLKQEKLNACVTLPRFSRRVVRYAWIADAVPARAGRAERAVSDPKRDAQHLIVKHEHGPPAAAPRTQNGWSRLHGSAFTLPSDLALSPSHASFEIPSASDSLFPIEVASYAHSPAVLRHADSTTGAYSPVRSSPIHPSKKLFSLKGDNCHVCC